MSSNIILLIVVGLLVLGLLIWLLAGARRTRVEIETRPGDEPARRNQALIDAPPATATATPPVMPDVPVAMAPVVDSGVVAPVAPVHPEPSDSDDLTRLKGVGPKVAEQLRALGVTRFSQIARWDDAEIDRIDAQLGRFQGRIRRDDWPTQARFLESGDSAGYEAKFGRL